MKSLKAKLMCTTCIICVICLMLTSVISYHIASESLYKKESRNAELQAENSAKQIDQWINGYATYLETVASTMETEKIVSYHAQKNFLSKMLEKQNAIDDTLYDIYFTNQQKQMASGSGYEPDGTVDFTQRAWFLGAKETDGLYFDTPYKDADSGRDVITISKQVQWNGQFAGVLSEDIFIDEIVEVVNQCKVEGNSYTMLIDQDMGLMVHPNEDYGFVDDEPQKLDALEGNPYASLVKQLQKDNEESVNDLAVKDYDNVTRHIFTGKVASCGWVMAIMTEESVLNQEADSLLRGFGIATIASLLIAILLIALVAYTVTKPIKLCLTRLKQLSEGDLTTVVPKVRGKDESAELLNNLNKTIGTLRSIIQEINVFVQRIAEGNFGEEISQDFQGEFSNLARSLSAVNDGIGNTIKQIDLSTNKFIMEVTDFDSVAQVLAAGTTNQAEAEEELNATLTDISEKVKSNNDNTRNADRMMVAVEQELEESNRNLKNLVAAMNVIEANSNEIGNITRLMQNIASQTNLLSMNASVEASRAGESGKGFAVVAAEIRELAERCNKAAADTTDLIEKTRKSIQEGMESLNVTVDSLQKVSQENQSTGKLIREISNATSEQSESIKQISQALEQITNETQNNSSTAEKSARTSKEMRQSLEYLKKSLSRYSY